MPIWKTFGCSAVATCWAESCTLPIDTAKVRLQLQSAPKPGETLKYRGMIGTMSTIAKEEGMSALWAGLTPGLHRWVGQIAYQCFAAHRAIADTLLLAALTAYSVAPANYACCECQVVVTLSQLF